MKACRFWIRGVGAWVSTYAHAALVKVLACCACKYARVAVGGRMVPIDSELREERVDDFAWL